LLFVGTAVASKFIEVGHTMRVSDFHHVPCQCFVISCVIRDEPEKDPFLGPVLTALKNVCPEFLKLIGRFTD
jgi:hypothetical protein